MSEPSGDAMTTHPVNEPQRETADGAPHTSGEGGATGGEAPATSSVLNRRSPEFLARAHEVYADMRAQGPVVRAHVANSAPKVEENGEVNPFSGTQEKLFVTRYKEAASALLDDRLSSDFHFGMSPEQRAYVERVPPGESKPLTHSILTLDPPAHTRLRRLVQ